MCVHTHTTCICSHGCHAEEIKKSNFEIYSKTSKEILRKKLFKSLNDSRIERMKQLVYKNKSRWTTSTDLFSPDWITKLVNEGCNIFGLHKIFDSISGKKKKNLTWKINLNWLGYELCHTPVLILRVNFAFSARGSLGAHKTSPTHRVKGRGWGECQVRGCKNGAWVQQGFCWGASPPGLVSRLVLSGIFSNSLEMKHILWIS